MVLSAIQRLLLRASYHVRQRRAFLHGVVMEMAAPDSLGPVMSAVEICVCPPGYAGKIRRLCPVGGSLFGSLPHSVV